MSNGWNESAAAWIADNSGDGDFSRQHVLDRPMLERINKQKFATALDIGCGEGRFCRMLSNLGIAATGIDPTERLIEHARSCDPNGTYYVHYAEKLDLPDGAFDLVTSYLSMIDITDIDAAVSEMVRVLRPGGTLLIANLNSFSTAATPTTWVKGDNGSEHFCLDRYMEERSEWVQWRGIRIKNWHRPFSRYMKILLSHNLILRHFDEPLPGSEHGGMYERYYRAPYFHIMEWEKP
ncbi:class I SAM-dependent methyltransferase [Thalassospira xiamenensis]|uniref:class I SAM-dependent methyltransferase n=1 Tax=Thalassospira xiamenensis TaxID=220697 RepID=UPI003AA914AF